jgi:hypothetical protein
VATCPNGKAGAASSPAPGCTGDQLLPNPTDPEPPIPSACSTAGLDACPTPTSTLFDGTALNASPLSITTATPPTWSTTLTGGGYYVGLDDATIELIGDGPPRVIAGQPGHGCAGPPADPCGDGGPATSAQIGTPAGLAVGLDGTLYVADSELHRVRAISPTGVITTVAGSGQECTSDSASACGNGGPATAASFEGPYDVWASPNGDVFIADGRQGVREVKPDGTISSVAGGGGDHVVQGVVGDLHGHLYATTHDPGSVLEIDPTNHKVDTVVGTGTNGYNGNTDSNGVLLPGTSVQVNNPGGLAVARNGDVVFADTGNNLVRAYVPSSGHVIDLGGLVSNDKPEGGFNGDGQWADKTELSEPKAVALTTGALTEVADEGNDRVRQIGPNPTGDGFRSAQRKVRNR